jgi:hypothetical protein
MAHNAPSLRHLPPLPRAAGAEGDGAEGGAEVSDNVAHDPGDSLRAAIEHVINRHSAENGSDTPDFILAQFLTDCLCAFDAAAEMSLSIECCWRHAQNRLAHRNNKQDVMPGGVLCAAG